MVQIHYSITYLSAEVGDDDELLEDVLGEDVGVAGLLDIVGGHVDVVSAQVQVGSGDGSDAPFCLRREGLSLVVTQRRRDDLVSMLVHRPENKLSGQWMEGQDFGVGSHRRKSFVEVYAPILRR